jgi:hypothetical protein
VKTPFRLFVQRVLAAAVLPLLVCGVADAQAAVTAVALKAAFVVNFVKFTEWPADAAQTGPLTICVVGDSAIADDLDATTKGRSVNGHDVVVLRVKADGLRVCHVLYLAGDESQRLRQIITDLKGAPMLTVSDHIQFAQLGGMVGLFVEDGKMRFAINVEAAQRARLRISSKLLSLAKLVKDDHVHP